jgi:large subunit ribosomal protein L4
MKVDVYNKAGKVVSQLELSDDVFNVPFNEAVVHQALVRQRANRRQGNADTQTRGEVSLSTRKLFAQKHTGRARRGSARSPMLRGGGVAFGPHPRSFRQAMPTKMRRLAIRCVLSAKAVEGQLRVIDSLEFEKPDTKAMLNILIALGIGTSVLVATVESDENVILSARNLEAVDTTPARLLNVGDMLSHKVLLMTRDAVQVAEQLWNLKTDKKTATGTG